jgi:MraZ protein
MSLTGTYHRTLDDKQRLAVPKKLRDGLIGEGESVLYIAPETERALTLYSIKEFARRAHKLEHMSSHHETLKKYQRLYYSQAEQVELDSQGRIRLPERLMAFAGIEQEVTLLGVHDHVEIWERTRWNQFLDQYAEAFDAMANEAFGK